MGVNIRDLVPRHEIGWEELSGKTIAIDALNNLYQFLASIRQPDGTPLKDSQGRTTSHLSGLFYRTIRIFEHGIKPVYVFDGKPSELKKEELDKRKGIKQGAEIKWQEALEEGDMVAARRYASMTSRFTSEMLEESKELLKAMGVPVIQSPAEGEMQCAYMCQKGEVYATASQDYDSLLTGSPVLVRNLTLADKYEPERIFLEEVLRVNNLTREDLVDIAILVGTDFDPGIKGIGPKKALKAVKEGGIEQFRSQLKVDLDVLRNLFLKPTTTDEYEIRFSVPNKEKIMEILSEKHDFSAERVEKATKRLENAYNKTISQSSLSNWF